MELRRELWGASDEFCSAIVATVGDTRSIVTDYFPGLGYLDRFGLETPYAMPAPNNTAGASDEVIADIFAGRWEYAICYDPEVPDGFEKICEGPEGVYLARCMHVSDSVLRCEAYGDR